MIKPGFVITALALVALSVYLFVQAPAPLPDEEIAAGETISIETVLTLVAAENDIARTLWTKDIVGSGVEVGLAFSEEWEDEGVEAGPLPALFLRLAATDLQRNPIPLGLFLGSDFPISPSNLFSGKQMERFDRIKETGDPEFFFEEDTQLYTAMFADNASVMPCVDCHNFHPDSPKVDWVLNDVMGATTWAYPKEEVTRDEFIEIIAAVRQSFRNSYIAYLEKVSTFAEQPEIGEQWPSEGFYLPTADLFIQEFSQRSSANTVEILLNAEASPVEPSIEN